MNRADQRKYHYIYKITRLDESGKYYIGMHSTDDLEDGYFGSGTLLSRSIKKHGKEKHKKEILERLPTREALKLREKKIVNEELLGDKRCMNLQLGGGGGFTSAQMKELFQRPGYKERFSASVKHGMKELWQQPEFREKMSKMASKRISKLWKDPSISEKFRVGSAKSFVGKKHSPESIQKMKDQKEGHGLGEKNSQFGTCWVTKDSINMKIRKELLSEFMLRGYSKGRKL